MRPLKRRQRWRISTSPAGGRPARRRSAFTTPSVSSSMATGWQSTHTIVEIVTDDRPFLVDSVRMS